MKKYLRIIFKLFIFVVPVISANIAIYSQRPILPNPNLTEIGSKKPIIKYQNQSIIPRSNNFDGIKFAQNTMNPKQTVKILTVNTDSANAISRIWNKGDQYFVKISLADYQSEVSLVAYNMIGKEVLVIHQGTPRPKDSIYEFSTQELPNGVYFCVLRGKNFKKAEKFIVSKSR